MREYHAGIFSIRSVFGADFVCVEEPQTASMLRKQEHM